MAATKDSKAARRTNSTFMKNVGDTGRWPSQRGGVGLKKGTLSSTTSNEWSELSPADVQTQAGTYQPRANGGGSDPGPERGHASGAVTAHLCMSTRPQFPETSIGAICGPN
jgi:hypothetical protein